MMRRTKAIVTGIVIVVAGGCGESLPESDLQYIRSVFPESPSQELAIAAAAGDVSKIQRLVDEGADVNHEGLDRETPLKVAVYYSQPQSIAILLEMGADPNVDDGSKSNVMNLAAQRSLEILQMLIDAGGDPDTGSDRRNALIVHAADRGEIRKVKLLIEAGASPNGRGLNDDTALIAAARRKKFDTVFYLLEQGADYALINRADETLLDMINGKLYVHDGSDVNYHEKVVELLRAKGLAVNPR